MIFAIAHHASAAGCREQGALAGAMLWPGLLQAREAKAASAPARQAIVIYLPGARLSHYESFDPKPDAPSDYRRRRVRAYSDNIARHPLLRAPSPARAPRAQVQSDSQRLCGFAKPSGRDPYDTDGLGPARCIWWRQGIAIRIIRRSKSFGRLHRKGSAGESRCGLPAYVAIPHGGQLGRRVHYATAGPLGAAFEPMESGMLPERADGAFFGPRDLSLSGALSPARMADRVTLLAALNGRARGDAVEGLDSHHRHALEIISGGAADSAFDLGREPLAQRERYGNHLWGQQTVLARRLAEAGVPFTLVNYTLNQEHGQDWDTHVDNFNLMKNTLLPPMDLAVSALLDDLEEPRLAEDDDRRQRRVRRIRAAPPRSTPMPAAITGRKSVRSKCSPAVAD